MREKIIFENDNYRVVHKRSPFEEGDPEEYDSCGGEHEDAFDLCDLVIELIYATKKYSGWHGWLEGIASVTTARHNEELAKFKEIINRPGPFEPGGALYEEGDPKTKRHG